MLSDCQESHGSAGGHAQNPFSKVQDFPVSAGGHAQKFVPGTNNSYASAGGHAQKRNENGTEQMKTTHLKQRQTGESKTGTAQIPVSGLSESFVTAGGHGQNSLSDCQESHGSAGGHAQNSFSKFQESTAFAGGHAQNFVPGTNVSYASAGGHAQNDETEGQKPQKYGDQMLDQSPGPLDDIMDEEHYLMNKEQHGNIMLQEFDRESKILAIKVNTIADAHTKHVTLDGNSLAVGDLPDIYPKYFRGIESFTTTSTGIYARCHAREENTVYNTLKQLPEVIEKIYVKKQLV